MYKLVGCVLSLILVNAAYAGTEIVIQHDGQTSTVQAEGNRVRLNSGPDQYVLIDNSKRQVNTVKPGDKQIVTMDLGSMPQSRPVNLHTDLRVQGNGPGIAGYPTRQFSYTVNGKSCGVIYGSREAYTNPDIQSLFSAMKTMVDSQLALMGGFVAMMDDCKLGDMTLTSYTGTLGLPMRTERDGVVTTQVMSVHTDVQFPAGTFDLPEGFARTSVQQEMRNASNDISNVPQRMRQNPQMQQQMPQIHQPAQVRPWQTPPVQTSQEMAGQMQPMQRPFYPQH